MSVLVHVKRGYSSCVVVQAFLLTRLKRNMVCFMSGLKKGIPRKQVLWYQANKPANSHIHCSKDCSSPPVFVHYMIQQCHDCVRPAWNSSLVRWAKHYLYLGLVVNVEEVKYSALRKQDRQHFIHRNQHLDREAGIAYCIEGLQEHSTTLCKILMSAQTCCGLCIE